MKGDSEDSANQHVRKSASSTMVADSGPSDAGEGTVLAVEIEVFFNQKRYGVDMEFGLTLRRCRFDHASSHRCIKNIARYPSTCAQYFTNIISGTKRYRDSRLRANKAQSRSVSAANIPYRACLPEHCRNR